MHRSRQHVHVNLWARGGVGEGTHCSIKPVGEAQQFVEVGRRAQDRCDGPYLIQRLAHVSAPFLLTVGEDGGGDSVGVLLPRGGGTGAEFVPLDRRIDVGVAVAVLT